ncbi:hypothetical protein [Cohnella lupini]|uniref:DUF3899 domain-containing protein n=1 Tax=Cohnella lupini TaxID=1294267 RepID=A0A3D9HZZ0_9BACL|nr:hypothetical protein [Cohnella lupini]RED55067.1 hypothetical protein DFP95_1192 [Cohnella lupini]
MTLAQISDYLFLGSLGLLIVTLFVKGRGMLGYMVDESGATTDLQLKEHNHLEVTKNQDTFVRTIFKSYFVWISIIGMITAILITL